MKLLFIICAIVYLGAALPISLRPHFQNASRNDHLSLLEQFRKNPSTFVSQMSKADPTTLRTVLDLLRSLLTTSNEREEHLISTLNGKNDELNSANADVSNAQTVLNDAQTDLANAENAVTSAESDLAEKESVAQTKLTEKNDAQGNHDAEIDSLNDEQSMIQEVITILEDLLARQNTCTCSTPGLGTDNNEMTCTTGETRHCSLDQQCYATEAFTYGEWSDGCRIPEYNLVGNGWCLDANRNRINGDGIRWIQTAVRQDGSAAACEQLCSTNPNCIGYLTEDQSKCDIMEESDENAASGIKFIDSQTRNFCWEKKI